MELEQKLNGQPPIYVVRSQVSSGVSSTGDVIISWWEQPYLGQPKVISKRCSNDLATCNFLNACSRCLGGSYAENACDNDSGCTDPPPAATPHMCAKRTSCPASFPANTQIAKASAVAVDKPSSGGGNVAVTWQANVNDPGGTTNAFGRGFDAALGLLRNDFRVDVAGRTSVTNPRVAGVMKPYGFVVAWKDTRTPPGSHIYLREVSIAP